MVSQSAESDIRPPLPPSQSPPSRRARNLRLGVYLVCVALCLAAGTKARLHHIDSFPRPNQTADEFAWTWAGITMLTEGAPRSWSWLDAYGDFPVITWRGAPFRLVTPWLDHPPLFALLQGTWMVLRGYRDIEHVDLTVMREMSVLLFMLAYLVLWRVARTLLDRLGAVITLLIYATSSTVVMNSRLVISENLVTPLLLLGHLALLRWDVSRKARWMLVMGLCAFLMPLTKLPAVCTCFALAAIAWHLKAVRAAVVISVGTVSGTAGFYVYGKLLGGDLFMKVMDSHKDKFQGFHGFLKFFFETAVVNVGVAHLPFFLAFALAAHALLKQRPDGTTHAAIAVIAYPLSMTFLVVQAQVYGWYLLPLYPYLAILLGAFWASLLRGQNSAGLWIAIGLMVPQLANRSVEFEWWDLKQMRVRFALLALLTPLLTRAPWKLHGRLEPTAALGLLLWQVLVDVEYVKRQ